MKRRLGAAARPTPAGASRRRRWLVRLCLLLALAGVAYLARAPLLSALGGMLVSADRMERADAAVVLSGEDSLNGERVLAGVRLYREGWVRKLVLSGGAWPYHRHETDFSLPLAISRGVPREDVIAVPHGAQSTTAEAEIIVKEIEPRGIRTFYVVSSDYHTARARRIFRKVSHGRLRVLAYPAHSDWFKPDSWWQSREGRRIFLLEWVKTLNSLLE